NAPGAWQRRTAGETVAGMVVRTKVRPARRVEKFAATHRSLWFGSRPRPATGYFFWRMKRKILLVDDDPGVRRMLVRVLEEEDYLVFPAGTGREALQRLAAKDIDLVLLDLSLPLETGW